ncbi:hypothetical protein FA13DRAFT_1713219 [Coprinellus micaceus]|uniref:Nucleoplasmin-like domain-containing protein n=1 Tax=Coprinellus micaceus TaxID=71717 RepID=A0A4Y7SYF6_COPMI|nr:hypothetical protein FA13DRAFT_1713219 [Coprinellus micaceus]
MRARKRGHLSRHGTQVRACELDVPSVGFWAFWHTPFKLPLHHDVLCLTCKILMLDGVARHPGVPRLWLNLAIIYAASNELGDFATSLGLWCWAWLSIGPLYEDEDTNWVRRKVGKRWTPVRLQAQSALNQVVSSRVRSRLLKIVWTGAQFRGAKLLMQWGLCLVKVHQSYGVSGWSMALGPGRVGLAEASVLWRPPTYSFLWLSGGRLRRGGQEVNCSAAWEPGKSVTEETRRLKEIAVNAAKEHPCRENRGCQRRESELGRIDYAETKAFGRKQNIRFVLRVKERRPDHWKASKTVASPVIWALKLLPHQSMAVTPQSTLVISNASLSSEIEDRQQSTSLTLEPRVAESGSLPAVAASLASLAKNQCEGMKLAIRLTAGTEYILSAAGPNGIDVLGYRPEAFESVLLEPALCTGSVTHINTHEPLPDGKDQISARTRSKRKEPSVTPTPLEGIASASQPIQAQKAHPTTRREVPTGPASKLKRFQDDPNHEGDFVQGSSKDSNNGRAKRAKKQG